VRELAIDDDLLTGLEGVRLEVGTERGSRAARVSYDLARVLGAGTFSVAFYALRVSDAGELPAVVKVARPHMMRKDRRMMALVVEKERTALQRLNARVPPCPFVVRLFESSSVAVRHEGARLELPWLALEYVHGGVEGTTLEERVDYSLERTGAAFDARRAALAVRCLASGLEAIHSVGVVHRDLTPWNVLCCGFGHTEVFKISDFGIARPMGTTGTFMGSPGGTAGYAPPEQVVGDKERIGPASDVFALAGIVFRLLTGESYFPASTTVQGVLLAERPERRALTSTVGLAADLKDAPEACARIDAVLAAATRPHPEQRTRDAWEFARPILEALEDVARSKRPSQRLRYERAPSIAGGWIWRVRHRPGDARAVRSVAWEGDGSALVATSQGLEFWSGVSWQSPQELAPLPLDNPRFVRRMRAGYWLVGGDGATLAMLTAGGVAKVIRGADSTLSFVHASGDVEELAVIVGTQRDAAPVLYTLQERRWLEPVTLSRALNVTGLARLDPDRWIVCGRSRDGTGYAATFSPLRPELRRFPTERIRSYDACSSMRELALGLVVGAHGNTLRIEGANVHVSVVPGEPDLGAAAVDATGRAYAASPSTLWYQEADHSWSPVWHDPAFVSPFVSLFADAGLVIGMTADGGVVEGRWEAA
jgi:serine/threonine protein kinase